MWAMIVSNPIVACTTTSEYSACAKTSVSRVQRGRICTRSLASYIPRSSKDGHRECSPVFWSRFEDRLLASEFSSTRARCPKKVRQRDLVMDESGGSWLVMRRMSAFLAKSCQRMSSILRGILRDYSLQAIII